jgi:hypothetical protein
VFRRITLAALLVTSLAAAASVSIEYRDGAFHLLGVSPPPAQSSEFTVSTAPGNPPLFGTYSVEDGQLTFRPRYPLTPGVTYYARFRDTSAVIRGPAAAPVQPTHVVAMYPSAATLPANLLKLYVLFSEPMHSGDIWTKIHLIDQDGSAVLLPFVELEPELWNPNFTRLTLLFEPGRIKRGVKPNVDMGPVLQPGHRYTLVIDRELRDANGNPLVATFRHEFSAGPAERRGIDPQAWSLSQPHAGTTEPLIVRFDRPLDYALLGDVFEVPGVPGAAAISPGETEWRYNPSQPWTAGDHSLLISMALEDLAGNRIGRPFDVDEFTHPVPRITAAKTSLILRIR